MKIVSDENALDNNVEKIILLMVPVVMILVTMYVFRKVSTLKKSSE